MANLKEQAKALYLYGFPLVVTEATHWGSDDKGFHHLRTFPTDKVNKIVKLNNDTLYSTAWTQLVQTPYLVHIPKITERYYLFPILDAYTNVVESIGTRTPDRAEGDYILLYQDTPVPAGYESYRVIRLQDSLNAVLLRIETRGKADYPVVNRIQDSITIRPLYPERVRPVRQAPEISPAAYIETVSPKEFFTLFAALSVENPIRNEAYVQIFEQFGYDRVTGTFLGCADGRTTAGTDRGQPPGLCGDSKGKARSAVYGAASWLALCDRRRWNIWHRLSPACRDCLWRLGR